MRWGKEGGRREGERKEGRLEGKRKEERRKEDGEGKGQMEGRGLRREWRDQGSQITSSARSPNPLLEGRWGDLGKNSSVLTSGVLFLLMTVSHCTSARDKAIILAKTRTLLNAVKSVKCSF